MAAQRVLPRGAAGVLNREDGSPCGWQVFGLRGAAHDVALPTATASRSIEQCLGGADVAFVPHYRCASVPDFHRIPFSGRHKHYICQSNQLLSAYIVHAGG